MKARDWCVWEDASSGVAVKANNLDFVFLCWLDNADEARKLGNALLAVAQDMETKDKNKKEGE